MRSIGSRDEVTWHPLGLALPAVIQLAAIQTSPQWAQAISHGVVLAAALLATAYSAKLAFRSRYPREFLVPVALGLGLWTAGLVATLLQSAAGSPPVSGAGYSLLLISYGLPFLYTAATYADPYSSGIQKILDALLLLFLGLLFGARLQDVAAAGHLHGSGMQPGALELENAFLCAAHVLRWLTSGSLEARRCFKTTSLFLLAYTACAWLYAHFYGGDSPPVLIYLSQSLMPLPFLLLTLMLHRGRNISSVGGNSSQLSKILVLGAGPALLLAAIFALSIAIYARHPSAGPAIAGLAMAAYVLRALRTQYAHVKAQEGLQDLAAKLQRLSYTDAVTDIPNRHAFQEAYTRAWSAAERDQHSMSVLMIDVDRFKNFNDLYGHQAGDECLRAVAHIVSGTLSRISDFCGRYGGEEFVVFLAGTTAEGAALIAERIRHAVYEAGLTHERGIEGRVTVSIGIASREDGDAGPPALLERADANLYRAKALGRNRCYPELAPDAAAAGAVH